MSLYHLGVGAILGFMFAQILTGLQIIVTYLYLSHFLNLTSVELLAESASILILPITIQSLFFTGIGMSYGKGFYELEELNNG